jgi:hypothetical protein
MRASVMQRWFISLSIIPLLGLCLAACSGGSKATSTAQAPSVSPTSSATATATQHAAAPTSDATVAVTSPTALPSVATERPTATSAPGVTATTATNPTAATTGTSNSSSAQPDYVDDRSTPDALVISYYNAINRHEYLRAFSYWEANSPAVGSYDNFQSGYANTASVALTVGAIRSDVGAGQLYWWVPVTLAATNTDGSTQNFVGCYKLHLGRPEIQSAPPFQGLGISAGDIEQANSATDAAGQLDTICNENGAQPGQPYATATATATSIDKSVYLDDRSTAEQTLRSLYNAINSGQYARAYSYWEPGAAQLAPFDQFAQGYANTASVAVTFGTTQPDAGAGQLHYSVPVALVATQTDGSTQTFVGCYVLHLAQPAIQNTPPFQPLAIVSASIGQVDNGADTQGMLATACGQ